MTTICYRDGVLAADTLVTEGRSRSGFTSKIVRGPTAVAGAAGTMSDCLAFYKWVEGGCQGRPPQSENAGGLLIEASGQVFEWEGGPSLVSFTAPFHAIGSGAQFARGAMAHGPSAEEAGKAAALLDLHTGGDTHVLTLDDLRYAKPRRLPRKKKHT